CPNRVLRTLRADATRRPRAPVWFSAVPHRGAELRCHFDPGRAQGRVDGPLGPRRDAAADPTTSGDAQPHGAHPVHSAAGTAGRRAAGLRCLLTAEHGAWCSAVPERGETSDA